VHCFGFESVCVPATLFSALVRFGVEDFGAFDTHSGVHERADCFAESVNSAMMVDEFHKIIQYNVVTGHVRSS
jgi:hypothetical protein